MNFWKYLQPFLQKFTSCSRKGNRNATPIKRYRQPNLQNFLKQPINEYFLHIFTGQADLLIYCILSKDASKLKDSKGTQILRLKYNAWFYSILPKILVISVLNSIGSILEIIKSKLKSYLSPQFNSIGFNPINNNRL